MVPQEFSMNTEENHPDFSQLSDSKNLSQVIRSNAPEYWAYMKSAADLHGVKPYLEFEGAVSGDPHLGNFGPIPVTTNQGSRKMRFVDIDFDDAGRAPFVLDFIRYVAAIKAQCEPMKSEVLQENYVLGLKGKSVSPPSEVQGFLDMKVSDYDKQAAQYCEKHCLGEGFKFKAGKIDPYKGTIKVDAIGKLFPGQKVLSIAKRVEARGGSSGDVRIWALVEGSDSKRRIMELKQYATPGTAKYQPQPPVKRWLAEIRQAFWPGLTGAEYDLVEIPGAGLFWIREKRVSLINVPYSSEKKHEVDFVMGLAIYDANLLGLAHGRQAQGAAYYDAIRHDPEAFHHATKDVAHAYLDSARKAFQKEGPPQQGGGR
jgi:hypothetical protein